MAGLPNRRGDSLIDDLATLQPPNEGLPYRLAGDTSRCSRLTMISHSRTFPHSIGAQDKCPLASRGLQSLSLY